jgi:hypothetical protein
VSLVPILIGAATAIVSILVSLGTVYYLRRKDRRETHEQTNGDVALALQYKDDLIQALQDDREELKRQLKLSNDRNDRYETEVKELREQLRTFEAESRQVMGSLLESFAQSERCLKKECPARIVPGDRRDPDSKTTIVSAGGDGPL